MSLKIRFHQLSGIAALAAITGLWLSAQPAHAQVTEPPARVISRPDLAYPTPEMIAEEVRPARDEAPSRAQTARPGLLTLPAGRPWIELPPAWPILPHGAPGSKPDRYAPFGPSAPLIGNFVVNSTADTNLADAVLTLREALLVANGALNGPFTMAEQAQLGGCSFSAGFITGGCGANIQDSIFFAPALGFRPVITLTAPLPPISDTRPTLLLGAFLFNNVQPVINAQNLTGTQPGLVVQSNGNTIAAVSVISAPGSGIRINGNENTVDYWTMARNNGIHGIHIAGLTNTVQSAYIGVFSNTVTNSFECAGNGNTGILLVHTAHATTIRKNVIACHNNDDGVRIDSNDNLIGGSTYITHGNVIFSNWRGIAIVHSQRNLIQANGIQNNIIGISIAGGQHNTVTAGVNPFDDMNEIYNNISDGILFTSGAKGNLVANSRISSNNQHGVNLIGSGTATNTLTRTIISWNGRDGIRQHPDAGPNIWREMAIYNNDGLGIDIEAADHASNVPHPPYVFVTSVNPATGLVQGKANGSQPLLLIFTIVDLYRIALDPSGFGEGVEFVGSATTDAFGNWSITDPSPSLSNGCYTAVVRGAIIGVPYATEFSRSNCSVFAPIVRKP